MPASSNVQLWPAGQCQPLLIRSTSVPQLSYLQEPEPLGAVSRSHLRRSSGKERSPRSRDLLPLLLPSHVRAAVVSHGDAIAEATAHSSSRFNRKWRGLGIGLWVFLVICSMNLNWFGQGYLGLESSFDSKPSSAQQLAIDHITRGVTYFADWRSPDGTGVPRTPSEPWQDYLKPKQLSYIGETLGWKWLRRRPLLKLNRGCRLRLTVLWPRLLISPSFVSHGLRP